MSWFTKLFSTPQAAELAMSPILPFRSPWANSSLTKIVLADVLGVENLEITRADAMTVPPIARGRGLICGTLSRYPLSLWQVDPSGDSDLDIRQATPRWLTSTATRQSPTMRVLWTLDDLLFSGLSVWATQREGDQIVDAIRVPPQHWTVDPDTLAITIGNRVARDDEILVFEGPQEGLLTMGKGAIQSSKAMAGAWQQRVQSPVPLVELHQTDSTIELDEDEVDAAIDDWEAARRAGGTAFTPPHIEAKIHGTVAADLYVEGRNADRIDWANYLQLPAAMLDGSLSTATLTYSTQEGKRSEFVDYSLSYWAQAIEARLSQDDVCPDGTCVRFDLKWLTTPAQPARNPGIED